MRYYDVLIFNKLDLDLLFMSLYKITKKKQKCYGDISGVHTLPMWQLTLLSNRTPPPLFAIQNFTQNCSGIWPSSNPFHLPPTQFTLATIDAGNHHHHQATPIFSNPTPTWLFYSHLWPYSHLPPLTPTTTTTSTPATTLCDSHLFLSSKSNPIVTLSPTKWNETWGGKNLEVRWLDPKCVNHSCFPSNLSHFLFLLDFFDFNTNQFALIYQKKNSTILKFKLLWN